MMMSMNVDWKVQCLSLVLWVSNYLHPHPTSGAPFLLLFLFEVCGNKSDNIKAEIELSYSHDIYTPYNTPFVLGTTSIGPILVKLFSNFRLHENMVPSLGFTFDQYHSIQELWKVREMTSQ